MAERLNEGRGRKVSLVGIPDTETLPDASVMSRSKEDERVV